MNDTPMIGHNLLPAVIEPDRATLPPAPAGWQKARLPELYIEARDALLRCLDVDECLEWTRRAEAFASYYRQAQDRTPYNVAMRIRLRAWRRCGELFIEMDQAAEPRSAGPGRGPLPSTAVADKIGMTAGHRNQAKQLAKLSEEDFEAAVNAEPPMALSEIIRQNPYPQFGSTPEQRAAASVAHSLGRLWNVLDRFTPEAVAEATPADQGGFIIAPLAAEWLGKFAAAVKARRGP